MVRLIVAFVLALQAGMACAVLPIEHWTTPNGARVYFVRAPSIPMLDVSVGFDAGARFDPPGKEGLASLTAALLSQGADGLDETAIADRFADVGADTGAGASGDRASVTLRTLSSARELTAATALLERVLSRPSFPAAVLEREKQRVVQALREARVRPETIAQQMFSSALYPGHPYGRYATPESVGRIGRDDLVAFHRARYAASSAVVAMIGAVTLEEAREIARQLTARLPAGMPAPALPEVNPAPPALERRIEHPARQSHILLGTPGIAWGDPDYFPLMVGNYVLGGGGFVSRLYAEVRDRRGLAYSVYSYFSPAMQPGPFTIGLQTRREETGNALGVVRDTLERFVAQGPTDEELDAARSNLLGGFALRIDSNRKILDYLAMIGAYRLPLDWIERWPDRVRAVTAASIREAFARHVRPTQMITVVVGDAGTPRAGQP